MVNRQPRILILPPVIGPSPRPSPKGRGGAFIIITFLLAAFIGAPLFAQSSSEEAVLAGLVRSCAGESMPSIDEGSANVRVFPEGSHPMVRQIFTEELAKKGVAALTGDDAESRYRVEIDVRGMNASTVSLDNSSYLRTVTLRLGILIEEAKADSVVFSREMERSVSDTLQGQPSYSVWRFAETGESGSWIDSILTPALVSAGVVVIIVLLFTVRGS